MLCGFRVFSAGASSLSLWPGRNQGPVHDLPVVKGFQGPELGPEGRRSSEITPDFTPGRPLLRDQGRAPCLSGGVCRALGSCGEPPERLQP